jgi:hypothetical protein
MNKRELQDGQTKHFAEYIKTHIVTLNRGNHITLHSLKTMQYLIPR